MESSKWKLSLTVALLGMALSACQFSGNATPREITNSQPTPTQAAQASPTPLPTQTSTTPPMETSTPTETATPTEIPWSPNIESLTCESQQDCFEGKVNINPEGGKEYYHAIFDALLKSKVNDKYFKDNFGIVSPGSDGAYDELMKKLREIDYQMPAGLTLPGWGGREVYTVKLRQMGIFKADTLLTDAWTTTQYLKNLKLGPSDPKYLAAEDKITGTDDAGMIYGIRLSEGKDGVKRLNLILASGKTYSDEKVIIFVPDITKDKDALPRLDQIMEFLPYLFLNMDTIQEIVHESQNPVPTYLYLCGYDLGENIHPRGNYSILSHDHKIDLFIPQDINFKSP